MSTKTFSIYCSQGASRVIKFYSANDNLQRYRPKRVIYDGKREEVLLKLRKLFEDDLVVFNSESKSFDPQRIHHSTSEFIQKKLNEDSTEYLLCFGDKILKKSLVNQYSKRLINFHPSLLPSFKGLMAVDQALESGASIIGNTAHFIDEGIDTGGIILQTAMLREDFEDYEDVLEMQFPMIKMILRDLLNYPIEEGDLMSEISTRTKQLLIPKKCKL